MIKNLILKTIEFYKKFISQNLGFNCRFYPNCSKYTHQVVKKYGILKGSQKGAWRILKCNPFNKGGVDLP